MPCSAAYLKTFALVCRNLMPNEHGLEISTTERTSWNEWTNSSLKFILLVVFSFLLLVLLLFTFNTTLFHYLTMTWSVSMGMKTCMLLIVHTFSIVSLIVLLFIAAACTVHAQRMVPLCFFAHSKDTILFCSIKIGMQISDMYGVSVCVCDQHAYFALSFSIFSVACSSTVFHTGSQTGSSKFNSM